MTRQTAWAFVVTFIAGALAVGEILLMSVSFDGGDALYGGISIAVGAIAITVGWLVLTHQRHSVIGLLLCVLGVAPIAMTFMDIYPSVLLREPGSLPTWDLVVTLHPGLWVWLYVAPCLLLLLFPTGTLPGPNWRVVQIGIIAVPIAFTVIACLDPTPFEPPFTESRHVFGTVSGTAESVLMALAVLLLASFLGLLIASLLSVISRFRHSESVDERTQIKWLALAGLAVPGTLLLCWLSYLALGGPDLVVVGLAGIYVAMPLAVWIAINRHDLYDIERITSAAVATGIVATALLVTYTAAVLGVSVIVGRSYPGVAVAAASVVALGALALRGPIMARVDRAVYPARARAMAMIDELNAAVASGQAEPGELEARLRVALNEPELEVVHHVVGGGRLRATGGDMSAPEDVPGTPVTIGDTMIGEIVGSSHTSDALIRQIAVRAAPLVELSRLRLGVSESLREVERARRRVERAAVEERRRLERDLHDGAQQRLVSLGMNMRLAQRRLSPDSEMNDVLEAAVAELATVVAELREFAHGIRPSRLDDGLAAALTASLADAPIPVRLDISADDLSDELATTAYFVVSEAVANAFKHSGGHEVGVVVARRDNAVHIEVTDDGRGAVDGGGAGIRGLTDRVEALGGRLQIVSPPLGGTQIEAWLPCES